MRAVLGLLSLLIVVAVVGLLVKKQMAALPSSVPAPAGQVSVPSVTPQQQSQTLQNQVKKSVDEAMQAPRLPASDD
jgi:hypothetical protein